MVMSSSDRALPDRPREKRAGTRTGTLRSCSGRRRRASGESRATATLQRAARSLSRPARRSGSNRLDAAEATVATLELGDRGAQVRAVEVRPVDVSEDELGICGLPEQVVRNALFTRRANEQIDV